MARESFNLAGQDSFTNPPAQNPDLFQKLTNVEPVFQGNLQRRRGYTLFANTAPTVFFHDSFSYRNELQNFRRLVWTSSSSVVTTDEAGNIISNPLFTPSLNAAAVLMVLSRSFGYFADGVAADYVKWDGTTNTNNVEKWGISIVATPAQTFGPNYATTATDQGSLGSTSVWNNPTNAQGPPDGSVATSTPFNPVDQTDDFNFIGYGFTLPTSDQITGIAVNITGFDATIGDRIFARLVVAGAQAGTSHFGATFGTTSGAVQIGGPTDTWGLNLTGADVNAGNFGVQFHVIGTGGSQVSIDAVGITIFVSGSSIILGPPAGSGITVLNGRVYTFVFQNSLVGTTSGLADFSASTGPLTNQGQPMTGLPVSTDPQVDMGLLLATADGGDETTLYLVAQLPNGTTTYTDTMSETQLLLQPIYQETDSSGNLFGVANNNPPPLIHFPTLNQGRIFGTVGPTLFFSKNLSDVTTSTGTITTKWEEAWPATYSMDISQSAETVTGLLSDGQTLYIGTDACVRQLLGDSPSNFSQPQVVFNQTGVINQEVWKIVFSEGQPVGSIWLSPNNRIILSNFSTYQDIGTPIQDVLNSINTSVAQSVSHACFVSQGPSEYYMLYIPTGSSTQPNTVCVYNMRTQKWFIWMPTDTVTTSLYNISSTGATQWLFATQAKPIYFWDSSVNADRNGNTPVGFAWSAFTSWLDFGDMGLTKALNKMLITTNDPFLTITVQGAIRVSDFAAGGVNVLPSSFLQNEIFGDYFVPLVGQPGFYKWYQIQFTSPTTSTAVNVLNGFDIEVAPSMRM